MKGISHFAMGVAIASCFPEVVKQGANGQALPFVFGGIAGLLPDTLDFKFSRFFCRHEIEIVPDPLHPDPKRIADGIAFSIRRALETGQPVTVKLNTIRLGADRWQSYELAFDVTQRALTVSYGPIVDTGGNPEPSVPSSPSPSARVSLPANIRLDYLSRIRVDVLEGPSFRMTPDPDGRVTPVFIPWHRQWSHSLLTAGVLALVTFIFGGWILAAIVASAMLAHAAMDQLGYLGSNFRFPWSQRRMPGKRWMHAGDPLANLAAVWGSCVVIVVNLAREASPMVARPPLVPSIVYGGLLPLAILMALRCALSHRRTHRV